MGEVAVSGTSYHFTVDGFELFNTLTEGNDFCWTYKCTAKTEEYYKIHKNIIRYTVGLDKHNI